MPSLQVNANPSIALYHTQTDTEPINPVDLAVKRAVVAGALAQVLGHEHPECQPYEAVDLPEFGQTWITLARVYSHVVGPAKELTATMFRKLMQETEAAEPLIADEVRRLIIFLFDGGISPDSAHIGQ